MAGLVGGKQVGSPRIREDKGNHAVHTANELSTVNGLQQEQPQQSGSSLNERGTSVVQAPGLC